MIKSKILFVCKLKSFSVPLKINNNQGSSLLIFVETNKNNHLYIFFSYFLYLDTTDENKTSSEISKDNENKETLSIKSTDIGVNDAINNAPKNTTPIDESFYEVTNNEESSTPTTSSTAPTNN